MNRKLLLLSIGLVLILAVALVAAVGDKPKMIPIPDRQELQLPSSRASCTMNHTNGVGDSYHSFGAGSRIVSLFDPTDPVTSGCGIAAAYPFEITAFSFTLVAILMATWPANVDVVVYDLDPTGDPCAGPGAELCRYSIVADETTYGYPTVGTFTFPTPCCANRPFFIGLEYTSGGEFYTPGIVCDDTDPPLCLHYVYYKPNEDWYEWDIFWGSNPGNPLFWVAGETESGNCYSDSPKSWYQTPDLTELGMDVNASILHFVLADDFECTETAPITEIHIWGSWFDDIYPGADPPSIEGNPGNAMFHLSIHGDIPAGVEAPWSMPGPMLADWHIMPGQFFCKPVKLLDDYEGWFNPPDGWIPDGDRNCFEYIFQFTENNWFIQEGSEQAPVTYWLDVQAYTLPGVAPALFGWKTSINHWNDDAVWFEGEDLGEQLAWSELKYPDGHPYYPESIDQAFLIGGLCDCQPGEADGKPLVNILDIVYLINYKYKLGPDPIPYALCSGDTNCDCLMNILDIVYLINYKYKEGPHPCTCGNFIANCGGPLR